jgi:hypothetical protein
LAASEAKRSSSPGARSWSGTPSRATSASSSGSAAQVGDVHLLNAEHADQRVRRRQRVEWLVGQDREVDVRWPGLAAGGRAKEHDQSATGPWASREAAACSRSREGRFVIGPSMPSE